MPRPMRNCSKYKLSKIPLIQRRVLELWEEVMRMILEGSNKEGLKSKSTTKNY